MTKEVYICHTAAKGWVSRMIRKITGYPVSHSLVIYFSELADCYMIIESSSSTHGVLARPAYTRLEYLKESLHTVQLLDLEPHKVVRFLRAMIRHQGMKYDYGLNASWLIRFKWNKWRGINTRPRFNNKSRYNCSEAIASALRTATSAKLLPVDAVPGELMELGRKLMLVAPGSKEELLDLLEKDVP
jgi:hypothetical protein